MTEIPIPTGSAELEEMLNDGKKMGPIFAALKNGDPAPFKTFIQNYGKHQATTDPDLVAQVREQTQAVLAEMLRDNGQNGSNFKLDISASGQPRIQGPNGPNYYQAR